MSAEPIDVVLQNLPAAVDISWSDTLITNAFFLDRQTRALVDPDGGVTLYVNDINGSPTQVVPTKLDIGAYQYFVPPQSQPGKLKLTWQALDSSMNVIGQSQSVLNLVAQTI